MDKEQARKLYELADRLSKLDINTLSEEQLAERSAMIAQLQEVKQRLDPKCWDGYKKQGTKMKGDTRVNNCVPESAEQGVAEEFNGEYDDEAGMAESNLHTMARAVKGLLDTIEDNDNLPEWAQEKIAKAEMMVTSVWDYLLSQKEQGVDPKVEESQLDEIDRRGFLGALAGAGLAAAGLGAAGSAMAGPNDPGFVRKVQDKHFEMVEKNPRYANEHQALQLPFARGMSGNSAEMNKQWAIKTAQLLQKYGVKVNEGVAETKKPSPKLTAVNIKKTDTVSEEINTEAYERLQKVFAFKNYES